MESAKNLTTKGCELGMESAIIRAQQGNKFTALYCRLSVDDDARLGDSNSITHQKDILEKYAREKGFGNARFFVDDGVSGTIFNRPGLNDLLTEVKSGRVSTIVVKDQSRLGRDVLEVGLLKRMFDESNVRLVSATDGLDTAKGFDIMSSFRDVINEFYVSDTSAKIRAVMKTKALNGKHATPQAPYGYKPSERDKFVWEVDEPAARIVREIYQMCMNGMGMAVIGNALRARGIKNPMAYRAERDGTTTHRPLRHPDTAWGSGTVSRILENKEYIGTAVIGRVTTKSYKDHFKYVKPEEEWTVHENAHPAIIDKDIYEIVQRIRQGRSRHAKAGDHGVLNGMMFCRECGGRMHLKRQVIDGRGGVKNTYDYYVCKNSRSHTEYCSCTSHAIERLGLERLVMDDIRKAMAFVKSRESEFTAMLHTASTVEIQRNQKKAQNEIREARNRIAELDRLFNRIYEDNVNGKISDERFETMRASYEGEQAGLRTKAAELEREIDELNKRVGNADKFLGLVRSYDEIPELTAEILREFVEKIIIGEPEHLGWRQKKQEVRIVYNYIGDIAEIFSGK